MPGRTSAGTYLNRANMTNGALRGAKLVKADLSGATCVVTDLTGADVTGADTTDAVFEPRGRQDGSKRA
ncbi:MAG: pentapeptide repeat-containing protein [Halobacteriota archaeon]